MVMKESGNARHNRERRADVYKVLGFGEMGKGMTICMRHFTLLQYTSVLLEMEYMVMIMEELGSVRCRWERCAAVFKVLCFSLTDTSVTP